MEINGLVAGHSHDFDIYFVRVAMALV